MRFSCAGVILTNINYTVLRSAELVNDNFKSPDVNSINTLGYEYFNETSTTPSTAELSKETVIVGGEQYKILQIAPTSGTTRLQKVYSGLEVGKTYRVAVILPRTTYNVVHNGTTYQVLNNRLEDKALQVTMPNGVGIGMKDAYYAVAIPNYTFPANSKAGRGLTPDGNYHYWISFVATAPTATVTYLGASNNIFPTESSSTPGGYRLKNAGGRQILGFTLHQKIPTEEDGESDGYRYGFNTQQKQDDIYGPGNHNTALYWEYDTRLGRRWNLDPMSWKYPTISPYAVLMNSPFYQSDPFGDEVVNGHSAKLKKEQAKVDEAIKVRDEYKEEYDKLDRKGRRENRKYLRMLNKEIKKAENSDEYRKAKSDFDLVQSVIDNFKKIDPEQFDKLNNLINPLTDCNVDVQVYYNAELLSEIDKGNPLGGLTVVEPLDGFSVKGIPIHVRFGSSDPKYPSINGDNEYILIFFRDYFDNSGLTNVIRKDAIESFAHETGHAIFNVTSVVDYDRYKNEKGYLYDKSGHGEDDPSGIAATQAQMSFKRKRMTYIH